MSLEESMVIATGTFAVVNYRLCDAAGVELESSAEGTPITYIHGYGMLVPGLEAGLTGLRAGDTKTIVVAAADGFGERDEDLVFSIARADLPSTDSLEAGDYIVAEDADGDSADLRVLEVHDEHVLVDGNHELAGKELHFSVEVELVRSATAEELSAASSAFGEGEEEGTNPELEKAMQAALQELAGKRNLPN